MKKQILSGIAGLLLVLAPSLSGAYEINDVPEINVDYSSYQITSQTELITMTAIAYQYVIQTTDFEDVGHQPRLIIWNNRLVAHAMGIECDIFSVTGCPVIGHYLFDEGTIVVDFSALLIDKNLLFGLLVHEMVHFLQHEYKLYDFSKCTDRVAAEAQAYYIQQNYLNQAGLDIQLTDHAIAGVTGGCDADFIN